MKNEQPDIATTLTQLLMLKSQNLKFS